MARVAEYLQKVEFEDKQFIGTIAFRSEEITLPDGSKMALGIDDGHWVLVYQKSAGASFQVFKYDREENRITVDQKAGGPEEQKEFRRHLNYFFSHADSSDLITLLPPKG